MGTLYLVATPIGNLEDVTFRALRILREVQLIAAEDTRTTRRLLDHYGIKTPLTSYYEHNKLAKLDLILSRLATGDVALVSEAGMPGISDPGYELVRAAIAHGFPVSPIPGPSAVIAALAASGLPTDQFTYLGFLPRRPAERRRFLAAIADEPRTLVFFESPHRLRDALADVLATLGDRPIAVCRELTKLHEEIYRGMVATALDHFTQPRGEFTIVLAGASPRAPALAEATARLAELRRAGRSARDAVAIVAAETGLRRRDLYQIWLQIEKEQA